MYGSVIRIGLVHITPPQYIQYVTSYKKFLLRRWLNKVAIAAMVPGGEIRARLPAAYATRPVWLGRAYYERTYPTNFKTNLFCSAFLLLITVCRLASLQWHNYSSHLEQIAQTESFSRAL